MADLIKSIITFVVSNYALTFLVVGLVFSLVAIARSPRSIGPRMVVEKLIAWHVFFGALSASFIGWADSPFQFEVGTASLGFAAIGFIAAFRSFDLRLAAILGPGIFALGAAAGHIQQIIAAHDFAPEIAGVIFYTDIAIPLFGFLLLVLQRRFAGPAPSLQGTVPTLASR